MPRKKKEVLIGNGMNADVLKKFIDLSYEPKNMSAPEGFELDAPLSDSRVKVYTKNNSKDVIVTHRGSVGASDWIDNARYAVSGDVTGSATYKLHRARHKKAVEKYGASNIIAIGHSRAGLYIQELQKEFPIKENITYNKASGFHDIGRQNDANQTDVRVGNDVVSLLAPLQNSSNKIVNISGTKNPLSFVKAHATGEINKLGSTFIGKKDEPEPESMEGSGAIKRKRGRPRKVKVIIEGSGIGSSKTSRVSPHDIQVVIPQYVPPNRPVQIHPAPAPVPAPPVPPLQIPRPPRRPRQNFHSPQRKYPSKKGASSSASGSTSGSGLSSSKPEYLPPYLIEGYQTPIEGNLKALEYYKKLRDDLLKELADRNYVLTSRDDLPAKYKQLIRLDNRIHYLEKLTQKQPIMDSYSIQEAERKRLEMKQPEDLEGEGFNKKQLRQIILDKNKVIADLEEEAYGGFLRRITNLGNSAKNFVKNSIKDLAEVYAEERELRKLEGGAYCDTHYLDTILDNDTTPQNLLIHSYKSKSKYIQPLE